MKLDSSALRAACYAIARTTSWQPGRAIASSADMVTPKAARLFDIAKQRAVLLPEELDPNIVVRAVQYLGYTHAIPPMGDDETWFANMLDVLIELVSPTTEHNEGSVSFLRDVRDAVVRQLLLVERGGSA